MKKYILLAAILVIGAPVHGQLNEHDQKALKETQELLNDKYQRREAVEKNDKARAADRNVKDLFGGRGQLTDEAYALAADVFANVVKSANGDAKKMQEMMAEFQRNPAAFAESWTPEQKAKLKALAEKLGQPDMAPRE